MTTAKRFYLLAGLALLLAACGGQTAGGGSGGGGGGGGGGGYAFPDPGTLQITYPPSFGQYESLRQQAHQYCIQRYPSDPRGYRYCLAQLAANPAVCPSGDYTAFQNCTAAIMAGYPWRGPEVLTQPLYVVRVSGGFRRELDPQTGQVIREDSVAPYVFLATKRQPDGRYLTVQYTKDGSVEFAFWMNASCEILDEGGRPTQDALVCPVDPAKPHLMILVPPPVQGLVPSALLLQGGNLQDDFDEDGKAEPGYLRTTGSGGNSGGVLAVAYWPDNHQAKYLYLLFGQQGGANFLTESLDRFEVEVH
jgi:hypothetical protein